MKVTFNAVKRFFASEDGPTAVEYAVVVALIIVSCILMITEFGDQLGAWFTNTSATVSGLTTDGN
ncbi:MAG: Flp family type IVb pilin [Candidatus Omnitrophota bacterium]|jgi:pilus assembly protein Flp/PilA|nr:MAG: Flp family type IVb pilin [Candidatus Omnitrophota bacterium]